MTRGKASFLVLIVFLAGTVSGFFVGARVQKEHLSNQHSEESREKTPEPVTERVSQEDRIMAFLKSYLELEDSQVEDIRPLLRVAIREHRELVREFDSRVHTFIENSDRRIAAFLTEEQAAKLIEFNRKRRLKSDAEWRERDLRNALKPAPSL